MVYTVQLEFWDGDDNNVVRTEKEVAEILREIIDYNSCCASQNVKILKVSNDFSE